MFDFSRSTRKRAHTIVDGVTALQKFTIPIVVVAVVLMGFLHFLQLESFPLPRKINHSTKYSFMGYDFSSFVVKEERKKFPGFDLLKQITSLRKCDFRVIDIEEFNQNNFSLERQGREPLKITFKHKPAWAEMSKWAPEYFKKYYRNENVLIGRSLELSRNGYGHIPTNLQSFINKLMGLTDIRGEPWNVVDPNFLTAVNEDLRNYVKEIPLQNYSHQIFEFGTIMSGVSFNQKLDSLIMLISGKRRWFIYDVKKTPVGGFPSDFEVLSWFSKIFPSLSAEDIPMQCVQKAGELIYIPGYFYQSSINLATTVSIVFREESPTSEIEKLFSSVHNEHNAMKKLNILRLLEEKIGNTEHVQFLKAMQLLTNNNTREAQLGFQNILKIDNSSINARLQLARLHKQESRFRESERFYREAMEINPLYFETSAEYGALLEEQEEFAEAAEMYLNAAHCATVTEDSLRMYEKAYQMYKHIRENDKARSTKEALKISERQWQSAMNS